jgi:hypothetical protein
MNMLLNRMDGMAVGEDDKRDWLDNPCTAVYLKLCLDCMSDTIKEMMGAKSMNDVCEARGAYRMCLAIVNELSKIPSTPDGGLTREQSSVVRREIQEIINEAGDRPDDRAGDGRDDD